MKRLSLILMFWSFCQTTAHINFNNFTKDANINRQATTPSGLPVTFEKIVIE